MIHLFGDSHASDNAGWKDCSNIISHYKNSTLCYSIGRDGLKRLDIRNYNIENKDILIFCYGEIDCRCHVKKHVNKNISYQKIIDNIINKYFSIIKLNIEISKLDVTVCVYNVPPPVHGFKVEHSFGFIGTDNERKQYHLYFNNKLKEKCEEYGYIFFDIYDKYCDDKGFLKKELSDNNLHIKNGEYLMHFIKNNL